MLCSRRADQYSSASANGVKIKSSSKSLLPSAIFIPSLIGRPGGLRRSPTGVCLATLQTHSIVQIRAALALETKDTTAASQASVAR